VLGITITHDEESQGNSCIASDMKEAHTRQNKEFNAAIEGLESFILAQFCAGIDVTSSVFYEAIEAAYNAISTSFIKETSTTEINSLDQLVELAKEFDGEVILSNPTDIAPMPVINKARDLIQQSNDEFTLVVPDNVQRLLSGSGCGDWLPALVYLPNKKTN
jgi:hypothetical protein